MITSAVTKRCVSIGARDERQGTPSRVREVCHNNRDGGRSEVRTDLLHRFLSTARRTS